MLYLILMIIVLIVSIVNAVSYFKGRGDQKSQQINIMKEKMPDRALSEQEKEAFNEIYGKKVEVAQVYRLEGTVDYISVRVNGATSREFFIGGIAIHNRCINKLSKKPHQMDFTVLADRASKTLEIVFPKGDVNGPAYLVRFADWSLVS